MLLLVLTCSTLESRGQPDEAGGETRFEEASCPKANIVVVGGRVFCGWHPVESDIALGRGQSTRKDMAKSPLCAPDDSSHVGNTWLGFHGDGRYGTVRIFCLHAVHDAHVCDYSDAEGNDSEEISHLVHGDSKTLPGPPEELGSLVD